MFEPEAYKPYDFANRRHIGPSPEEIAKMLKVVGFDSLEALIDATVPGHTTVSLVGPTNESETWTIFVNDGRRATTHSYKVRPGDTPDDVAAGLAAAINDFFANDAWTGDRFTAVAVGADIQIDAVSGRAFTTLFRPA